MVDRPNLRDDGPTESRDEVPKKPEKKYERESTGPRVSTQEPPAEQDAVLGDDDADDDAVTLDFPGPVNLQHGGMMHRFGRGQARCRRSVVMEPRRGGGEQLHWYLRHCGVRVVGDQNPLPRAR